jgi:quercetin dioxygenase-like cupin family protein
METMKREETWQHGQRNAVTLLKSESLRIVLIALRGGAEIDFRQSDNLICLHLLKGKLEFNTDEEKIELGQGHLLTLHENVQHSLIAVGEVVFLLTIGNGPHQPS